MIDFKLPSLGADMDEGALVAWLVEPGDSISRGQVVAEVETDKGIIEVECWEDAVVDELLVAPSGERIPVGTLIAHFLAPSEAASADAAADEGPSAEAVRDQPSDRQSAGSAPAPSITPPIRHLAHELGVDLRRVTATGPAGSITRDDVRSAVASTGHAAPGSGRPKASPRARRLAAERGVDISEVRGTGGDGLVVAADVPQLEVSGAATGGPVRSEPDDKSVAMRRAIARQMERSKREIPHYYLGDRIDLSVALDWLDRTNDDRPITSRILPAVLLLKATALALTEVAGLNGHWIDGGFVPSEPVHLGVAVSLRGGGLVAPAIHDAERRSLDEMMEALSDLVARARSGRLKGSEMTDPTSTVTNLGDRGVASTFPVIIPPQVSIIGFGKVVEEPVAVGDQVAIRPVVQSSLAADHRVTDGHTGGMLLRAIDRLLQDPEAL